MAPIAAPDMMIPGIEDVIADAQSHGRAGTHEHSMVLNMGPQHPSTHGVLRLVLEIDGEAIVSLAPIICVR
jgi:NADH-quinone oxidoreductase subunit D